MLDRQFLPLLSFEVVGAVGIHGEYERCARRLLRFEFLHETGQHRLRLLCTECAVHEVVLHIDYDDCFPHDISSYISMNVISL